MEVDEEKEEPAASPNVKIPVAYEGNDVVFTEGDEEVMYVVADFGPELKEEDLQPGMTCVIKGLHTATPQVLVDGRTFNGKYEDVIGTLMVFETWRNELSDPTVSYIRHTQTRLNLSESAEKRKSDTTSGSGDY